MRQRRLPNTRRPKKANLQLPWSTRGVRFNERKSVAHKPWWRQFSWSILISMFALALTVLVNIDKIRPTAILTGSLGVIPSMDNKGYYEVDLTLSNNGSLPVVIQFSNVSLEAANDGAGDMADNAFDTGSLINFQPIKVEPGKIEVYKLRFKLDEPVEFAKWSRKFGYRSELYVILQAPRVGVHSYNAALTYVTPLVLENRNVPMKGNDNPVLQKDILSAPSGYTQTWFSGEASDTGKSSSIAGGLSEEWHSSAERPVHLINKSLWFPFFDF